jgi:hypothetical protein
MVLIAAINFLSGCAGTKRTAVNTEKYQVSGLDINGLSYKVFVLPQQPGPNESRHKGSSRNLIFSITVTNTLDNTSPLRKISGDLDQYNTYYEYLLNRCKENLVLKNGNELAYPVYYSFENNYNAFPFETINVGYRLKPLHKNNALTLQFTDLVFAHDTLNFPLNNLKY